MFRKLTFAGLAGLGLLSAAPVADAATVPVTVGNTYPISYVRHHHQYYRILYRTCARDPWVVYGSFPHRWEPTAGHRLHHRGYEVFVR